MDKQGMGTDVMTAAEAMKKREVAAKAREGPLAREPRPRARRDRRSATMLTPRPPRARAEAWDAARREAVEAASFDDLKDEDIDKTEL